MRNLLDVNGLYANIDDKKILKGVDLSIKKGQVHVIMGPNGSGKSTLANIIMGNPKFKITKGTIKYNGKLIKSLSPEERAQNGIFMAFQYPREIAGVSLDQFLFLAYQNIYKSRNILKEQMMSVFDFNKKLHKEMTKLSMDTKFAQRSLNQGFSGGEKKKAEMLQLAMLDPELAIFDETDSGLDIDALKIVAKSIKNFSTKDKGVLLVTHYQRLLKYIKPDYVHVMVNGKIVKSEGPKLAQELEKNGYEKYLK